MNDRIPGTTYDNPIWHRGYRIYLHDSPEGQYAYCHDDYDGAPDSNDVRYGNAATVERCKREIDDIEAVLNEDAAEQRAQHGQFGAGA
jgi:hypothetical protein